MKEPMTLKEIIDNLGFDFRDLSLHSPSTSVGGVRWLAKGGRRVFGHWKLFRGHTPEQACYKLLDAINNHSHPSPPIT